MQPHCPEAVRLVEYGTVRQSKQITLFPVITVMEKVELQTQAFPFTKYFRGSWQTQAPDFVALVNTHTRAGGHWQLLVPKTGPLLYWTVKQSVQTLQFITLVAGLQERAQVPTPKRLRYQELLEIQTHAVLFYASPVLFVTFEQDTH
jgi:hypothetical protein